MAQDELRDIAAKVAKALGLGELSVGHHSGAVGWETGDMHATKRGGTRLLADGSNLFDPYWQVRCRDWLLERGWSIEIMPRTGMPGGICHWDLDSGECNEHLILEDTPPSEFCARAIAKLMENENG